MKKVILLGVAALSLAACGTQGEEEEGLRVQTGELETVSIEGSGEVRMSFTEEEATLTEGDSIGVTLENDTDQTLSMGRYYHVEYSNNEDSWTPIDIPVAFTDDMVMVEPGDEHAFNMLLLPEGDGEDGSMPEYESGRYRLRKEFSIGDVNAIDGYEISVEFDLDVE
ncbi:MAG: hypothetical protein JJU16_10760 [Alkalibacterium sp.]|nr:hypothetical protein [Alkalibacterium sp.]